MTTSPFHHREPSWRLARCCHWQIPTQLKPWLLGRGSLTTQLIAASAGNFSVEVLKQSVDRVYPSEARLLGLQGGRRALIREVILSGCNQPWVFARSVMPLTTLSGRLRALRKLDNRPLGHHLFSYPSMRRGPIEVARIQPCDRYLPENLLCPPTESAAKLMHPWARRSIFHLDDKPLLVSEVFLPDFSPGQN